MVLAIFEVLGDERCAFDLTFRRFFIATRCGSGDFFAYFCFLMDGGVVVVNVRVFISYHTQTQVVVVSSVVVVV